MDIKKAIIPAAGVGTRFLPFTNAVPKEMIPLLNKPAIQHVVQEALDADINAFFIITNKNKEAIANHFDVNPELNALLKERGKADLLAPLERIARIAQFNYIRQPEPLGLGHALWLAKNIINKEYFSVMLPDDIIVAKTPGIAQLMQIARQEKASVIAVQEVPLDAVSSYGVIAVKKQITQNLFQVSQLVEKPASKDAPSNLAVVGRYVLSHKIFPALEEVETDVNGEMQLTDGICQMIRNNEKVFAFKTHGIRYDLGSPIGWLKATLGCALQDPYYAPHMRALLEDRENLETFMYNPTKLIEHTL